MHGNLMLYCLQVCNDPLVHVVYVAFVMYHRYYKAVYALCNYTQIRYTCHVLVMCCFCFGPCNVNIVNPGKVYCAYKYTGTYSAWKKTQIV